MSPDTASVLIACIWFGAITFHVALDNAIAAIRWARSRG